MKPVVISLIAVTATALLLYSHRKKITTAINNLQSNEEKKDCNCATAPIGATIISINAPVQKSLFPNGLIQHHSLPTFSR